MLFSFISSILVVVLFLVKRITEPEDFQSTEEAIECSDYKQVSVLLIIEPQAIEAKMEGLKWKDDVKNYVRYG